MKRDIDGVLKVYHDLQGLKPSSRSRGAFDLLEASESLLGSKTKKSTLVSLFQSDLARLAGICGGRYP